MLPDPRGRLWDVALRGQRALREPGESWEPGKGTDARRGQQLRGPLGAGAESAWVWMAMWPFLGGSPGTRAARPWGPGCPTQSDTQSPCLVTIWGAWLQGPRKSHNRGVTRRQADGSVVSSRTDAVKARCGGQRWGPVLRLGPPAVSRGRGGAGSLVAGLREDRPATGPSENTCRTYGGEAEAGTGTVPSLSGP